MSSGALTFQMALTKREVDMSIQYFGSDTFYSAMQAYCEEMGVTTEELATYVATTPDGEEFEFDICDAFLMGTPYPKMLEFVNKGE